MLLVTGPTGSGKTLTLYTLLQRLNREGVNIATAEDPVEMHLPGINQVAINDRTGLGFAGALRAFLRQDPDTLMVGEIRDLETADIAIKAAQTGHRVLSTLHTRDAPGTLARLMNMGIAPFHIAASVRLITAQRLVRRLCTVCRQPLALDPDSRRAAGFSGADLEADWTAWQPTGCPACDHTGFHGRIGVHQVMPVSEAMRRLILRRADVQALSGLAGQEGIRTLHACGLAKVRAGLTSLDEIEANCHD
jgi:type IV pilus assembly protein PilB